MPWELIVIVGLIVIPTLAFSLSMVGYFDAMKQWFKDGRHD